MMCVHVRSEPCILYMYLYITTPSSYGICCMHYYCYYHRYHLTIISSSSSILGEEIK